YVALADDRRLAWRCWRAQAPNWPSPNAGPVMASGAAALGLALGGPAAYDGVTEHRPALGQGKEAHGNDIARAWKLVRATTILWLTVACTAGAAVYLWSANHA
ncbi:MAG: cobalamin biosynthesis protein, partial [Massilia sp.]